MLCSRNPGELTGTVPDWFDLDRAAELATAVVTSITTSRLRSGRISPIKYRMMFMVSPLERYSDDTALQIQQCTRGFHGANSPFGLLR